MNCFVKNSLLSFITIFVSTDLRASPYLVRVSSDYRDKVDGSDIHTQDYGFVVTHNTNLFVITSSHLTQGRNLKIEKFVERKLRSVDKILRRTVDNLLDIEVFEINDYDLLPLAEFSAVTNKFEVIPSLSSLEDKFKLAFNSFILQNKNIGVVASSNSEFTANFHVNLYEQKTSTKQRLMKGFTQASFENQLYQCLPHGFSGAPVISYNLDNRSFTIEGVVSAISKDFKTSWAVSPALITSLLQAPYGRSSPENVTSFSDVAWQMRAGQLYRVGVCPEIRFEEAVFRPPLGNASRSDGTKNTSARLEKTEKIVLDPGLKLQLLHDEELERTFAVEVTTNDWSGLLLSNFAGIQFLQDQIHRYKAYRFGLMQIKSIRNFEDFWHSSKTRMELILGSPLGESWCTNLKVDVVYPVSGFAMPRDKAHTCVSFREFSQKRREILLTLLLPEHEPVLLRMSPDNFQFSEFLEYKTRGKTYKVSLANLFLTDASTENLYLQRPQGSVSSQNNNQIADFRFLVSISENGKEAEYLLHSH